VEPIDPDEPRLPRRDPHEQARANNAKLLFWLMGGVFVFSVIGAAAHAPALLWAVVGGVGVLIAVGFRLYKDISPIIAERKRREQGSRRGLTWVLTPPKGELLPDELRRWSLFGSV
jgi:hypothetical protein